MSTDPTKLPEEEVTPQEQTTEDGTTTEEGFNLLGGYRNKMESLAQEMETNVQAYQERQKRIEDLQKKREEARTNRTSLINSITEQRRPVYDENKEKRMRAAAIIQSLGDVLAAATKGAIAYGKKGAGVVPVGVQSNAMEGVAKINELQQKYLQERKAWEDLVFNWEAQKAQDDIAAAEALLSEEQAMANRDVAALKALRDKYEDYEDKITDFYVNEYMRQLKRQEDIEDHEKKAQINRQYAVRSGGGGGNNKSSDKKEDGFKGDVQLYFSLFPIRDTHGQIVQWKDLSQAEKDSMTVSAKKSPTVGAYNAMIDSGIAVNRAREVVTTVFSRRKIAGKSVEALFQEIITAYKDAKSDKALDTFIIEYLNSKYPRS